MNAAYVQRGEYIDFVPEADVHAGDVIVRGRLAGVAKLDIRAGELGAIATTGVYDVAKGDDAFEPGDRVSWDSENRKAVKEGGTVLGVCTAAADASCGTVRVLLQGGEAQAGGGESGGPGTPSGPVSDVVLASVTSGGAWSGGDGNVNMVTDFKAFRDTLNAVLAVLRGRGIVGEA